MLCQRLHRAAGASHRRAFSSSSRPAVLRVRCAAVQPSVVVTREHGKNGKLIKALSKHNIHCIELPLIQHAPGPDREQLPTLLQEGAFDWIACTSPESAAVFIEGWKAAGQPEVRVAVVGGGTGEVLNAAGIKPGFTASKALGKVMGSELPHIPGGTDAVLYPASVKASQDLQNSLAGAGFKVQRINTYNTVGVTDVDADLLQQAIAADVVTFGSPSAVKAWVALVGLETAKQKLAVCIGITSAQACWNAGLDRVLYPEAPGIDTWAENVVKGLKEMDRLPALVA